jgi:uncharacterized phiE125 gp8 family phage protein
MGLALTAPPAVEPVGLAETKEWCRVDTGDGDATILSMIRAARQHIADVDGYSGLVLITQTITWSMDVFPGITAEFPRWPVQAVSSVKYYDANNVLQTVAGTVYQIDAASKPARLMLQSGQSWPASYPRPGAVQIAFTAGYGDEPEDVPETLRVAVKALVAHWHEYREPVVDGQVYEVPYHVTCLVAPHRLHFGVG